MKKTYKTTKKVKRNKKRKTRKHYRKYKKGGVKLTEELTEKGAKNRLFETNVDGTKIRYVIPCTFLFKEVQQTRIPSFFIKKDSSLQKISIQIEKGKFIDYLVEINGNLYAIMRLYGFTNWNNGALAQLTNKDLFIKIKNDAIHIKEIKSGDKIIDTDIVIKHNDFDDIGDYYFLKDSDANVIQLKRDKYELLSELKNETEKKNYDLLVRFRSTEIIKSHAKEVAADVVIDEVAASIFDNIL